MGGRGGRGGGEGGGGLRQAHKRHMSEACDCRRRVVGQPAAACRVPAAACRVPWAAGH